MAPPLRRPQPQSPFEPGAPWQPDEATFARVAGQLARGEIPLGDVIEALDNRNVPPQLRQTVFMKILASATDAPALLIPANKNRMSFIVSFVDSKIATPALVLLTYGPPPATGIGLPLLSVNPYGESNGTISIDDIYISPFNNVNNVISYPAVVVAYEGALAIESHRHRQTSGVGR